MNCPYPTDPHSWSFEDAKHLEEIDYEEDLHLEYKKKMEKNYEDIEREIAAFANAAGGVLLLGMSDDREATGFKSSEIEPDVELANNLNLGNRVKTTTATFDHPYKDEYVFTVCQVDEAKRKPVLTRHSGCYLRVNSSKQTMGRELLSRLLLDNDRRHKALSQLQFEYERLRDLYSEMPAEQDIVLDTAFYSDGTPNEANILPFGRIRVDYLEAVISECDHLMQDDDYPQKLHAILDAIGEIRAIERSVDGVVNSDRYKDEEGMKYVLRSKHTGVRSEISKITNRLEELFDLLDIEYNTESYN